MRELTNEQFDEILREHQKWIESSRKEGKRADFINADLKGAVLNHVDLRDADLTCADLRGADLDHADLRGADLTCANLYGARARFANFYGADLRYVIFRTANLSFADFSCANLVGANCIWADFMQARFNEANAGCAVFEYANLKHADLKQTDFSGADLYGAVLYRCKIEDVKGLPEIHCPEKGRFVGYKKAEGDKIVVLEILEDSKRSSATSNKCRCDKALVLEIQDLEGRNTHETKAYSTFDPDFVYEVDQIVSVDDFDDYRWNECSTGIHFFMTREEAVDYPTY